MDAQLRLLTAERRSDSPRRPSRPTRPTHTEDRPGPALAGLAEVERPEAPAAWRIDDSTKAVGRHGLALARAALRNARRPLPPHADAEHQPTAA
jgi:hypothetical protein